MTMKIKMSKSEIALSHSVICPKCGRFPGKRCWNAIKEINRKVPHSERLMLAKNPPKKMHTTSSAPTFKPDPKAKLTSEQKEVVNTLNEKIHALGAFAEFLGPVSVGPVISTYRFLPVRNTRVSTIEGMAKDFAVALGAEAILVKRMPGESAVGVYVPNVERRFINFKDTVQNVVKFWNAKRDHMPIPLNLGEDQIGQPVVEDLTLLPHLLIAGSTGGGKSTLLHSIVASLVFVMKADECKLIISDTKGVEFRHFADLPHLKFPIATNVYQTMANLQWCIEETQTRLNAIGDKGCRNIIDYNKVVDAKDRMPYVVVVIDELADIMGAAVDAGEARLNSKKLSAVVARSRATGIHVIAGTQRPDVKTVSGAIKANFPARLSFRLPSQQDSRTVLTTTGAQHLLSRGDMLMYSPLSSELRRLHAPYTSIQDVIAAVQYVNHRDADFIPKPAGSQDRPTSSRVN